MIHHKISTAGPPAALRRPHRRLAAVAALAIALASAGCGSATRTAGPPVQASATPAGSDISAGTPAPVPTAGASPSAGTPVTTPATTLIADTATPAGVPDAADTGAASSSPAEAIGWQQLANLAFQIGGDTLQLEEGAAEGSSHGGASKDVHTLQELFSRGDLNGDGRDDLVAYLQLRTGGSGVFDYLVPVFDQDGAAVAQQAVLLGDRVVVEGIAVRDGLIYVSLFNRGEEDPYVVLTQLEHLVIDVGASPPLVATLSVERLEEPWESPWNRP